MRGFYGCVGLVLNFGVEGGYGGMCVSATANITIILNILHGMKVNNHGNKSNPGPGIHALFRCLRVLITSKYPSFVDDVWST
jgi:hypothetical protein